MGLWETIAGREANLVRDIFLDRISTENRA